MCYFKLVCVILINSNLLAEVVAQGLRINGTEEKVLGGTRSSIASAPFMALIFQLSNYFRCGACIVHPQFLVSASHCFTDGSRFYAKVGTDYLYGGTRYEIARVFIHPRYGRPVEFNHDVAVVKLLARLVYNRYVQPIRLAPRQLHLQPGTMLDTLGFGRTERGFISYYLMHVKLPYIESRACSYRLWYNRLTPSMICAGGSPGRQTCKGDSGGPLIYNNMLLGITSFGFQCGDNKPGVYASIPYNRDFITSIIGPNI